MPLNACIADECQFQPVPGSVFCAGHHAEMMGKAAGVVEPEVEEMARAAKSEDDMHPGMRKVYDRETGEAEWVSVEVEEAEEGPLLPLPTGLRTGPFPGVPVDPPRRGKVWHDDGTLSYTDKRADDWEVAKPDKAPDHMYFDECVRGMHGAIRESVAKAMLEAGVTALRKL